MTDAPPRPVLWHIGVSHYSEKARWALAYKGVEHDRREVAPGAHMAVALWLTRGGQATFPILVLDGEIVGGSDEIIGALEKHRPEPQLYPEDPAERRRALDLAAYFDQELGPAVRLLGWHHLRRDPKRLEGLAAGALPEPVRRNSLARAGARTFAGRFVALRFRVSSEEAAAGAREKVLAGIDRLEAELAGGDHLVGEEFSVADLTAAALLYPFVLPPEGPRLPEAPASAQPFLDELRRRPFWGWVERTFARYR